MTLRKTSKDSEQILRRSCWDCAETSSLAPTKAPWRCKMVTADEDVRKAGALETVLATVPKSKSALP